jgi:hypothetical protein
MCEIVKPLQIIDVEPLSLPAPLRRQQEQHTEEPVTVEVESVPSVDNVPEREENPATTRGLLKIPPEHKLRRALRRASRLDFVGACVWCGHGYRRFSLDIQEAHLRDCAEYQRAKRCLPKNLEGKN